MPQTLKMKFKIFTLHPDIFTSFVSNSLIARAISKQIINIQTIDWRQDFGIGNYKQVDDKPFGGGSGMVLMAGPIINAMISEGCLDSEESKTNNITLNQDASIDCHSEYPSKESQASMRIGSSKFGNIEESLALSKSKTSSNQFNNGETVVAATKSLKLILPLPNNSNFYQQVKSGQLQTKQVNILLTPRGFPINQQIFEWLAQDFNQLNILCGRYEGFDARINDHIDLELSVGDFVLNGGEVAAMCIVEAVSRLMPDFITKNTSVLHDSFSSGLNDYKEFEFDNSKPQYQRELEKSKNSSKLKKSITNDCHSERSEESPVSNESKTKSHFNNNYWLQNILPYIEHPQYTRPNVWHDSITNQQKKVPEVLLSGDHAKIQKWRVKWW